MKKLLSAGILFLLCTSLKADVTTFQIVYGDTAHSEVRAIVQTTDNHYAYIGSSTLSGDSTTDLLLTIIDSVGNPVSVRFSTLRDDYGFDLKQTSDKGYIICGSTFGSPLDPDFQDIMLIKTDQFGSIQWANAFGNFGTDRAFSVSVTQDGYFMTGVTNSGDSGYTQALVFKVNFSGTPLWWFVSSAFNHSIFNDGCFASDSSTIAVGCTIDSTGSKDLLAVKYDSTGTVVWSKRYAAAGDQDGNSILAIAGGGCIIAGYSNSDSTVNGTDMLVTKLDSAGNIEWTKTYNYLYEDVATKIIQLRNGNYAVTGFSNTDTTASGTKKVVDFLELNTAGDTVLTEMYGDLSADNISYSIAETQDTGFVIGGVTKGFSKPNGLAYIIKTDSLAKTILCENALSITIGSLFLADSSGIETDTIALFYSIFNLHQAPDTESFSAYCFSLTTGEHQSVRAINMYPNPVQQTLTVDLNNSDHQFKTLIISDVFGRIVAEKKIDADQSLIQLNTAMLKPGIYEVELRGQKNVAARKFVKVD